MDPELTLETFWDSSPQGLHSLDPQRLAALPAPARRYLGRALPSDLRLARSVRLEMHGEIKVGRWLPFRAQQVIRWDRGMIWRATARLWGLPITGSDRLVDGEGSMRWRLLGLIPLVRASGADVSRSAAGRLKAETIWLPSVLCGDEVAWTELEAGRIRAAFPVGGEASGLELAVGDQGDVDSILLQRWGNPGGGSFRYGAFGGLVEDEGTFDGYTIPSRLRIGWHFGSGRFEQEGEFFRVTVDRAVYR
jgi:hypothetical protein